MAEPNATPQLVNGVNLDQVLGVIDAIKADSNFARITLCAETEWIDGHHNTKIKIQKSDGSKIEAISENLPFSAIRSVTSELLGNDGVPNSTVHILAALSSCIAVDFVLHAALRGIQLDGLQLHLEADIDLRGFFGMSDKIRSGYQSVQLTYHVKSDAPHAELKNLCEYVQKISPVLDSLRHPVPVTIELES